MKPYVLHEKRLTAFGKQFRSLFERYRLENDDAKYQVSET